MNDLAELTERWKCTKIALKAAQDEHLRSEISLYNAVKDTLPEKGTTTLETGLKIVTGCKEAWDQERLNQAWNLWPEDSAIPFPFKTEWKPEGKQISYIRDNVPAAYKLLSEALTISEKKPAFSLISDKE